jgi:hypothetical protein
MVERSRLSTGLFWVSAFVGWLVITIGIRGILDDSSATRPGDLARWFVVLLLVHDALLVPVVLIVGWLLGRVLPAGAVVPARLGLAASALIVAVAFPLVRGYGERGANPSLLPLDYGRNLAIALGLVWLVIGLIAIGRSTWTRR